MERIGAGFAATGQAGTGRLWALAGVVALGLGQSVLTYLDVPGGPRGAPLVGPALDGQRIWRRHNCQACHQVHGFGGFLGPDLTNVASRYTADELEPVLTVGRKQMPAFDFDRRTRARLAAYLAALDATGAGEPAALPDRRPPPPPPEHFRRLREAVEATTARVAPAAVLRGEAVVAANGCAACHLPLRSGRWNAPDLSLAALARPPDELRETIRTGRGVMPAFALPGEAAADVVAWLQWWSAMRERLVAANDALCDREPFDWGRVPWFEYR